MFEQIRTLLSEHLDVDIDRITPDTDISADLGADSLDIVDFLDTLEQEFNVTIPQDAIKDVKTVGELAEVVENL
jgi:acyl carrier protein